MKQRIAAVLVSLLLVLGIASPARADTYHSCISGSVCLYQWTNFSGPNGPSGRYQVALSSIWHASTGCWNILAWWPNNDRIAGNSWSYVVNPAGTIQGNDWRLYFYTGQNCSGTSGSVVLAYETENAHMSAPFVAGTPGIWSMSVSELV